MELVTARDLMIPLDSYPWIQTGATLHDAIHAVSDTHIEAHSEQSMPRLVLVLNEEDHLVGMLRRRDILRALSPRFLFKSRAKHPEAVFDGEVASELSDMLAHKIVNHYRDHVSDSIDEYVQPIQETAAPDHSVIRLIKAMVENGEHMLPVLEDEHVIGVVRSVDVLWAVNQMLSTGANGADD